jgi:asparagine synthase (glutamine-hydrolysing)
MSVQAGIWSFDGNAVSAESLLALTHSVAEYGPDGATSHLRAEIGMLYRPLHTMSESRLEEQPLVSEAGNVVTFDGRLDNREALLQQLCDVESNCRLSDVTLVAAAFDRWDCGCFAKFVGDWAIAVWAKRDKRLFLARDYIGVRPLFYHRSSGRVTWCSQLEPLTAGGGKFTLCEEYIAGYLAGFPDADLTPYQEIRSVPPGGYVRIDKIKSTAHLYWTFDPSAKTRYNTDEEYEEHFRQLFRQSVRRRLRADCSILAGLSGGLDSSSIVCVADEICQSAETAIPRIDTFSFCDRDEPEEDDFLYFTKVEERRGRVGHHSELKGSGDSLPIGHSCFTAVPGFGERQELRAAMSRVLDQGRYRILLSGIGGDEFLGQAFNPHLHLADSLLRLRLKDLARSLMAWSLTTRQPWLFLLLDTIALLLPVPIRTALPPRSKAEPWINPRFARRHGLAARTYKPPKEHGGGLQTPVMPTKPIPRSHAS